MNTAIYYIYSVLDWSDIALFVGWQIYAVIAGTEGVWKKIVTASVLLNGDRRVHMVNFQLLCNKGRAWRYFPYGLLGEYNMAQLFGRRVTLAGVEVPGEGERKGPRPADGDRSPDIIRDLCQSCAFVLIVLFSVGAHCYAFC
ncbi:hypothetical protein CEXT_96441 [Caerostris extrusa]|uniref:Uncharacterized protein n=1 Tax=Caerostris extrusa TaxID=172846 RepID=A0AAV4T9N1_CAEEX|nr:hypothetical protein CEXT_96441 [Caerostris extrusa]